MVFSRIWLIVCFVLKQTLLVGLKRCLQTCCYLHILQYVTMAQLNRWSSLSSMATHITIPNGMLHICKVKRCNTSKLICLYLSFIRVKTNIGITATFSLGDMFELAWIMNQLSSSETSASAETETHFFFVACSHPSLLWPLYTYQLLRL